mmetsp:Transcript_8542/g.16741  ORF Transcript_8542/g.16741 Transcript_8542/m.16741 type:complete len:124 (-) Transcript_8542:269-640(-)
MEVSIGKTPPSILLVFLLAAPFKSAKSLTSDLMDATYETSRRKMDSKREVMHQMQLLCVCTAVLCGSMNNPRREVQRRHSKRIKHFSPFKDLFVLSLLDRPAALAHIIASCQSVSARWAGRQN